MTTRGWERRQLEELVTKGKAAAAKIKNANILLKVGADGPGWTDEATAQAFRCTATTVQQFGKARTARARTLNSPEVE